MEPWTDADLDRLSASGPEDFEAAAAWWRRTAPPGLRALLDDEDDR